MLIKGLEEEGYQVENAADGQTGLRRLLAGAFDLCVLDVLLPGLDGFSVIDRARKQRMKTPILILTARDGVPDRVRGLNLGADDYLVKPFAFAELLARLQALSRRGTVQRGVLVCGDLRLDPDGHRAWRGDKELELSHRQFLLLEYLLRHQGQVVTRAMILKEIWGYDFNTGTNIVDVHMANLRQRVDASGSPSLIQTVRGVGYRILSTGGATPHGDKDGAGDGGEEAG